MHRFSCLESEFSCIAGIPTSNDNNILVGNSQLYWYQKSQLSIWGQCRSSRNVLSFGRRGFKHPATCQHMVAYGALKISRDINKSGG